MAVTNRTLVWGGGAIGGVIAAHMLRAQLPVTLVDIEEAHVARVREHGLELVAADGAMETLRMDAVVPGELTGIYPRIILCVKGQHTHAAVNKLQAFLSQDGWVLAMQNGLTEHRIAQTLGRERTIGAHINFAADYLEPGRIQYGGKGSMLAGALDVAGEPNAIQAVEMLRTAFPEARYTNELMGYKWSKVCLGAMLFVTAMSDEPMADQFDNTKLAPLWRAIAKEVLGVAQASGVHPQAFDGFDPDAFLNVQDGADAAAATSSIAHHCRSAWLAKPHSGIWRDLYVRRRPTEVDPQITDVVWHAEKLGMKAPMVGRLIVMIREIESGRRTSSPDNAIELMRMIEC